MLFLSRLLSTPLTNVGGARLGRIVDVVVEIPKRAKEGFPYVVGCVVDLRRAGTRVFVPYDVLEEISPERVSIISNELVHGHRLPEGDEFLFLKKSVLDKQIVDLAGVRIVRVNDLCLSVIRGQLCLVSIDVSNRALLRRILLPDRMIPDRVKPHLLEWKDVQVIGNHIQLAQGAGELVELHPADIANIVEQLNVKRGGMILESLDHDTAARVLEEIQPDVQRLLIKSLGVERALSLMQRMSIDELVDLIQQLPTRDAQEIVYRLSGNPKSQHLRHILHYDKDTAGGLMTTEYVSAGPSETVEAVVKKIKKVSEQFRSIQFVYIVDENQQFVGVVSLRKLIVATPQTRMKQIIKNSEKIPTVDAHRGLLSVARKMTKYNLTSIAVLGHDHKLLGVITVDDVMRRLVPNA